MKTPTPKQQKQLARNVRLQLKKQQIRISDLKSQGVGVIGASTSHLLQTAYRALDIAQDQLLEIEYAKD